MSDQTQINGRTEDEWRARYRSKFFQNGKQPQGDILREEMRTYLARYDAQLPDLGEMVTSDET